MAEFKADDIIACRHRAQYLAMNKTGRGFLIDYTEARLGFVDLTTFSGVTCVWNDEYNGDAYICADKKVYRWDSPNTDPQVYRWRSKRFFTATAVNLGAAQVSLDPSVKTAVADDTAPELESGDTTVVLPDGANAVFNMYVGPSQKLMHSRVLTKPESIFRLPSGFKTNEWQFEIVSRVPVRQIQVASTMHELKNV